MTIQRQIGFWIAALVVAVLLLFLFRGILLPFVAGFALAYLLDPLADKLQKVGIGRLGASLLILVIFVLVFIVTLMILVPFAAQQVGAFVERLPRLRGAASGTGERAARAAARAARRQRRPAGDADLRRQPDQPGRRLDRRPSSRASGPEGRRCSASSRCWS